MHPLIAAMGGSRQVTFGAAGTGAGADALTPVSVPYPASITAGMFLLLHVVAQASFGVAITEPSGWTTINSQNNGDTVISKIFWKRATGAESGNQDVEVFVPDVGAIGRMYRFSHGSAIEAAGGAMDTSGDTTINAVDLTTTVAKTMAVQCFWHSANTTIAALTGESGADYTEAAAEFNDVLGTLSCQVAQVATPAAITGGTSTAGASGTHAMHGFAIKP